MEVNIRQAILSAADQIERHPESFNFMVGGIPHQDGPLSKWSWDGRPNIRCVGCTLGWISHFVARQLPGSLRTYGGAPFFFACRDMPELKATYPYSGDRTHRFYTMMDDITGGRHWREDPALCAQSMRKYADMFHSEKVEVPVRSLKEWLAGFVPGTGHGNVFDNDPVEERASRYVVLTLE